MRVDGSSLVDGDRIYLIDKRDVDYGYITSFFVATVSDEGDFYGDDGIRRWDLIDDVIIITYPMPEEGEVNEYLAYGMMVPKGTKETSIILFGRTNVSAMSVNSGEPEFNISFHVIQARELVEGDYLLVEGVGNILLDVREHIADRNLYISVVECDNQRLYLPDSMMLIVRLIKAGG